jgi:hypothetical protein
MRDFRILIVAGVMLVILVVRSTSEVIAWTRTTNPTSRGFLGAFFLTSLYPERIAPLSFVTVAVVGPATQNAEAIPPLLVVGAAFVAGPSVITCMTGSPTTATTPGITTYTAQDYCNNLAYSLNQADKFTDAYIGDITNNIDLMQYFFIRQAQWAARELI